MHACTASHLCTHACTQRQHHRDVLTPFDVLLRVQGSAEPGLSVAATTSVLTSARPSSKVSAREGCQVTSVSVCMCVQQPLGGQTCCLRRTPWSPWNVSNVGSDAMQRMGALQGAGSSDAHAAHKRTANSKRHQVHPRFPTIPTFTRGNMHALKPMVWPLLTCMHRALMQAVNIHCSAYRRRCMRRSATLHWHVNWCVHMLAPCRHDASVCRLR